MAAKKIAEETVGAVIAEPAVILHRKIFSGAVPHL